MLTFDYHVLMAGKRLKLGDYFAEYGSVRIEVQAVFEDSKSTIKNLDDRGSRCCSLFDEAVRVVRLRKRASERVGSLMAEVSSSGLSYLLV